MALQIGLSSSGAGPRCDLGTLDDLFVPEDSTIIASSPGSNAIVGTGGSDADTFTFDLIVDAGIGSELRDIVTDFAEGTDKINLSAIDAGTATAGNQSFTFIGTGAFTSVAGQLRVNAAPSFATTIVEGDVNGDGLVDFQIMLHGNHILAAADFFL